MKLISTHTAWKVLVVLVSILASKAFAQEIEGIYIYGEGGGEYSERKLNFSLGQIDLFGLLFVGKAEGFAEIVFEQPEEAENYILDVERLYGGYRFHQAFVLRLGRFHSLLGISQEYGITDFILCHRFKDQR